MLNPREAIRIVYIKYTTYKKNTAEIGNGGLDNLLNKYLETKKSLIDLKLLSLPQIKEIEKEINKENCKKKLL